MTIIVFVEKLSIPNPMLSVIVPIGGFPNGIEPFTTWISSTDEKQIEIILVADFDDPNLMEEILLIAENSRVKIQIFESTARNPGGTRNIGISNASGDWICFWDADDYPDVVNMIKMVSESQNAKSEMAVGVYQLSQQNDFKKIEIHKAQNELDIYCDPGLWRMAFRREFVGASRFMELRMGEDQQFIFELLSKRPIISFSNYKVYRYVQYETAQLTKNSVAIGDLPIAMKECMKMYRRSNSTNLLVGIYKQSLTVLKRARLKTKFQNMLTMFKFWVQNPETFRKLPFCLSVILRYR
jgi:glycosyltransferase involved in cell wall biosynthesis